MALSIHAWITIIVLAVLLLVLAKEKLRADIALLSALAVIVATGVVTPQQAFAGIANPAVLTVAALFVIAAGIERSGSLQKLDRVALSKNKSPAARTSKLMLSTAGMSAFLNNTPIVALLIPRVQKWCEAKKIPASKMLIPLSYAAIVGGLITLIGTSTNLLVSGLLETLGYAPLGFFDLAWIGVPAAILLTAYFATVGHKLLPSRKQEKITSGLKDCLFELRVKKNSSLDKKTITQGKLRNLQDAFLVHVRRGSAILAATPSTILESGDVLTFQGSADKLEELLERDDLERTQKQEQIGLPMYEAVIAQSASLVGKTLREVDFRSKYGGVVLAINRKDAAIKGSLGRVKLQAGDLLLIEAAQVHAKGWMQQREEFALVAAQKPARIVNEKNQWLAWTILLGVVGIAALGIAPILITSFIGAMLMILLKVVSARDAQNSINFSVLAVIAAALGVGQAVQESGLAQAGADIVTSVAPTLGVIGAIIIIYVVTNILTELVTNNAAAAIMLGVGIATAEALAVSPIAFAITVAVAASASFLTPIGYQTNLMVMSAGGYRFKDYFKSGIVVSLLVMVVTVVMVQAVYL